MANYKDKTILFFDNGLFCEFAITLAQSFGHVYYYMPWITAFPKSNNRLVGVGAPNVTRVYDFMPLIDEVDLFVFPDVYFGELQEWLVRQGKRVWGARTAEFLELDRPRSKELCRDVGIDIGPYEVVTGIAALREYLRDNKDQFVKVSLTRGDMETFHAPNYRIVEPKLDELEWMLGAKKTITNFVVEQAIPAIAEVGYDGFVIDGKFADQSMFGIEVKDKGFVMECVRYADLPASVRSVNSKLTPIFRDYQSRGFFSTEIRVTDDGGAYLIDPCMRLGSPANELQQVLVKNYDDIIWEGAGGVVVEPECTARFGAQLMLRSAWADKNWQPIEFPASIRDFVKLHNMTIIDGRYYVVPQNAGIEYIGAAVATGNTMDEAVANCKAMAAKVEGYYLQVFDDSLDEAVAEYEKLKELE